MAKPAAKSAFAGSQRKEDREFDTAITPEVYRRLKKIAHAYFQKEKRSHTLVPTALVHEAFMRFATEKSVRKPGRTEILSTLARLMREILINHAKAKTRLKRGGKAVQVTLNENRIAQTTPSREIDLPTLEDALNRLSEKDKRLARLVELRYFGGLTIEETAEVLGVSTATVKRDWSFTKAWLHNEIDRKKNSQS